MRRRERPAGSVRFKGVQHRVERARADLIAVPRELLDHPVAIEIPLGRVVQHMQPHKAREKFLMLHRLRTSDSSIIGYRYRESIIRTDRLRHSSPDAVRRTGRSFPMASR